MEENYKSFKTIPTVFVDKRLIEQIENYILNEIPKKVNLSQNEISNIISIELSNKNSTEIYKSISDFSFEKFPDNTREIRVTFNLYKADNSNSELLIILYFSHNKYYNAIDSKINMPNGKMILSHIVNDLQEIIKSKKTLNYFFYPSNIIYGILVLLAWLSIPVSFIMFYDQQKTKVRIIVIGSILAIYLLLLPELKPYSSFDTSSQKRNDTIVNFIILVILTYIISNMIIPLF